MYFDFMFFINSALLGIALAMDAFSVSLANGLYNQNIKKRNMFLMAFTFAFFQALMPFIGWFCVHSLLDTFKTFEKFIPWIALTLLAFIGTKMIIDSISKKEEVSSSNLGFCAIIIQGIATSIDALSVGFTFATYNLSMVLISILIISIVTFILCLFGVIIGKKFGTKLSNKATLIGGIILILIGLEIFITRIV